MNTYLSQTEDKAVSATAIKKILDSEYKKSKNTSINNEIALLVMVRKMFLVFCACSCVRLMRMSACSDELNFIEIVLTKDF